MRKMIITCSVVFAIVLLSGCVSQNSEKQKNNRCREGFTQINNGCTTKKINFECTDKIQFGKGYYICGKFIYNIEAIKDYQKYIQNSSILKVKGKTWSDYKFCPTDPNASMPMTCDWPWDNIQITSYQVIK